MAKVNKYNNALITETSACGTMAEGIESDSILAGSGYVFDIVCSPCNSEGKHLEAEGYCMDCREHVCVQCMTDHKTIPALKKHKLLDKDNMPLDQKGSDGKDVCTEVCHTHKGKTVEYFCPTHKFLGCNVCMSLDHKHCQHVAYIPEVSVHFERSQDFKTFKRHLHKLVQMSASVFYTAGQYMKTSGGYYSRAKRDIHTFRQEINTALDKMESDLEQKLEQMNKQITEELQAASREAKRVNDELQAIADYFKKLISMKQNCRMFTQMKYSDGDLSKLQETLKELEDTCLRVCKFSRNEKLPQMLKEATVLGSVQNTGELGANCVANIKVKSQRSTQSCDITGLCVVSGERLVVTDFQNDTVKLIDLANHKMISELQLKCPPWAAIAISTSKVAVTQPSASKIMFLTCEDKIVVDSALSVQGMCWGIADYQNKLIVTFGHPVKLEILSMTGEVLQRFEKIETGKQLLSDPSYISVDTEEPAMFVSGWSKDSLVKISMDGKVLGEYNDRELRGSCQGVIDQSGLVYLCGRYSNNIHLLTTDFTKLKTIVTKAGGLQDPSAIAYCETMGRLYVGMWNNDRINVYQLHH